jgi:purine nucleosidase
VKRPLLLDMDPGIDDALAILYAVGSGQAEIVAAGSVHGNVTAEAAAANLRRLLDFCGCGAVPVAVGARRPLAQPLATATWVHGADGLGGLAVAGSDWLPTAEGRPIGEGAADQIVRCCRQRPGELTIVATGPLTNLALALLLEPELPRLVRRVVVMGGAVTVPGNLTPHAEANIGHDPEAADLVLTAGWPLTLVGLDVTMRVLLRAPELARLQAASTPAARLASAALAHYVGVYQGFLGERACPLHDPLAVAVALDPDLVRCEPLPVRVELRGAHTRGMTCADRRGPAAASADGPAVDVALAVDAPRFLARFLAVLTDAG